MKFLIALRFTASRFTFWPLLTVYSDPCHPLTWPSTDNVESAGVGMRL